MFKCKKWDTNDIIVFWDCKNKLITDMLKTFDIRSTLFAVKQSELLSGNLRNIGIAASSGEYIYQWDDDDLDHPMRISVMMTALSWSNADSTFLDQWLLYDYSKKQPALSHNRVWEGSVVMRRSSAIIYPEVWARTQKWAISCFNHQ